MAVRLFVGNLPYNLTEAELRELFSAAGTVSYVSLPTDRESGRPRGFAFVEFNDPAQAEDAVRRFNNQTFKGRPISVSVARAKEDRPSSGGSTRSSAPRLNLSRPAPDAEPNITRPAPASKRSRDFGPDASPHSQRNKGKGGPRPERGPKGPMREMVRGQFFGEDDEEDDFYEDADALDGGESAEESLVTTEGEVKDEETQEHNLSGLGRLRINDGGAPESESESESESETKMKEPVDGKKI